MKTNKLEKLFDRLRQDGWYCGWGLMCCSSCAWAEVPWKHEVGPFTGEEVDLNKVLFNHEQDCEIDLFDYDEDAEECEACDGDDDECTECNGTGWIADEKVLEELDLANREYCIFPHYTSDEQKDSCFCFSGDKEGVANLKAILPIIEEMGCTYNWNGKADTRISIDWE